MTREEAIMWLIKPTITSTEISVSKAKELEAYDMAIEALQTIDNCEQCEWCCPSDGIPTIHVVRCKDCRHKVTTKDGGYNPEDIVCDYWSTDGLTEMDFCTYGERRSESEVEE